MKILVTTDDAVGPAMAGSGLRAWELARALAGTGHEVRLEAARGSTPPSASEVEVADRVSKDWPDAVIAPPWSLHLSTFTGNHRLIIDGVTPLLAELAAMPAGRVVRWRRRTAAARLPLVAARADAVLAAGRAQREWWRQITRHRPEVPILDVPFGVPDDDPPDSVADLAGVPDGWPVVLWWGGVWPWLDLDTLLAARALLGDAEVSVVVPTAPRPGSSATWFSADDLDAAAARVGLSAPAVVALDSWVPYSDRHLVLNRADVLAVLHHPSEEAELCFRTRALDGLWSATPLLLTSGGEISRLAADRGWGEVVEPNRPEAVADALNRMLEPQPQQRRRSELRADRDAWRWSEVVWPLDHALPAISTTHREALRKPMLRATATLLGLAVGDRP
jgi:glycosyltransferase involved in cell wall biosynthesis